MSDEELIEFVRRVQQSQREVRIAPLVQLLDPHVTRLLALAEECLARRKEPELPPKVAAVVGAARAVVARWVGIGPNGQYGALIAAVKALDGGGE